MALLTILEHSRHWFVEAHWMAGWAVTSYYCWFLSHYLQLCFCWCKTNSKFIEANQAEQVKSSAEPEYLYLTQPHSGSGAQKGSLGDFNYSLLSTEQCSGQEERAGCNVWKHSSLSVSKLRRAFLLAGHNQCEALTNGNTWPAVRSNVLLERNRYLSDTVLVFVQVALERRWKDWFCRSRKMSCLLQAEFPFGFSF